MPEVLREYGYETAAFGKWHNSPADQTTAMGPFDRWPTGHGFDYFYGFIAGETSQYEPRLYENTNPIEPPHDPTYHLSSDMADQAITWLHQHQSYSPDKPFFMWWTPGAAHGPHHIFGNLADDYTEKGTFNDGWDEYRKRVFQRQQDIGWIPKEINGKPVVDTPRPDNLQGWDEIPDDQKDFQIRLMEVYAAFAQHADYQAGRVIDELENLGIRDNTLIFYIWGDNGASAEGQQGSISELLAQNQIPNTIEEQIEALDDLGGLSALGTPKTDNMYHAGWAWAGDSPFRYTKLIASHFGGTRNPLVISWPKVITPDETIRSQFHHVNDIAPTIYDILDITPPEEFYGFIQDPLDGVSMKYTFDDADAPGQKMIQYFENNGSRGIYFDGWYACTFGPLSPWSNDTSSEELAKWDSSEDVWELYDLTEDFNQSNDLADEEPEVLEMMKQLFLQEAGDNSVYPVGGGLWTRIHPEDVLTTPYTSWIFDTTTTRMPEFTAPRLGNKNSLVTIDVDIDEEGNSGVLYALGGAGGGLTFFMDEKGRLRYEYNMMLIERYKAKSEPIPAGHHTIEVQTTFESSEPLSPADVSITVDGVPAAFTTVERTVPGSFTASETFDVGTDLGSPVSRNYAHKIPFAFDGTINKVTVKVFAFPELLPAVVPPDLEIAD